MKSRIAILAVLTLTGLAGCTSSIVQAGMGRLSKPSTTSVTKPAEGAPAIWATLPVRNTKFSMAKLAEIDGVTVWQAKDGSQLATRSGMLLNTRNFGRDLMSAQVPTLATISSGKPYNRIYFDLDGTDTMQRHDFSCTGSAGSTEGTPFARHLVEDCTAVIGTIRNEFWLDSGGRIAKSLQWVSQGVGYVAVEKKDG